MNESLAISSGALTGFFRSMAIAAMTLLLLVGAFLSFRHNGGVVFPDEKEYYTLAENLVKYHMLTWDGVAPTASRPPGFIFWLAIWRSLGIGWSGLVWLNSFAVAAAFWMVTGAWFSRENLWPCRAATFALIFCYPVSLYIFSTLYPQAFCLALLAVALALLAGKDGLLRAAVAGLLVGWCVLSAPMYLTWAGVLALVPIFKRRGSGVVAAVIFSIVFASVVGGWGVRNTLVMGKFIPFSTNSGFNLLIGNCETTRPNAGLNIDVSKYENQTAGKHMSETELDAFYSSAAKKWVLGNPLKALSMYFQKLLNYFNFRNELVTTSAASPARDALMFVTYYGLMVVLLLRFFLPCALERPGWKDGILLGGYWLCAMFTSIAVTRIRYRMPCDVLALLVIAPLLAGMAKAGVARFLRGS